MENEAVPCELCGSRHHSKGMCKPIYRGELPPPRITRTRWQLVRWHLRCAWLHALGRL